MKNHHMQQTRKSLLSTSLALGLLALLLAAPVPEASAGTSTWSYRYYKDTVELTFYPFEILLYDPTPPASTSLVRLEGRRLLPDGDIVPATDVGSGWSVLDLSGASSGGDPEGYALTLIDDYAATGFFAGPAFGDENFRVGVKSVAHVGFEYDVPQATVDTLLQAAGLGTILESDWIRPNIFRTTGNLLSGVDLLNAVNALAMDPDVRFATIDWFFMGEMTDVVIADPPASASPFWTPAFLGGTPAAVGESCIPENSPADPLLFASWALEQGNDIDLDAYGAWPICTGAGDEEVLLAIMDNGVQRDHPEFLVDPNHPELGSNILEGVDTTDECVVSGDPTCDGRPHHMQCEAHGTAVSAAAAGRLNGFGTAGIAPNVKVLPIRVAKTWFDEDLGRCQDYSHSSWVAKGITQAAGLGARVTSLSWNWGFILDPAMQEAYADTLAAGMMHFNSAGNVGWENVLHPGRYPEVHSISGVDSNGERMSFNTKVSNIGPDVAFSAPAQFILTADLAGADGWVDNSGTMGADHIYATGTSFAAPMAAAMAAMVFVIQPTWTPADVLEAMRATARDLGDPGRDDLHGDGFLQAGALLQYAYSYVFADGFETGDLSRWSEVGVEP